MFVALMLLSVSLFSQEKEVVYDELGYKPVYVGVSGGIPFAKSTFTGYSPETPGLGFSGGLFVGYNFNYTYSLDVFGKYSNLLLGHHKTCYYSLSPSGERVLGGTAGSMKYEDLYVQTNSQNYGLRFNVDLLQLFSPNYNRRLNLNLSPFAGAYVNTYSINKEADKSSFVESSTDITFGGGAEVSLGYKVSPVFNIALYSSIAFLNSRIDNIQTPQHPGNFIHDTGLKLTFAFGKNQYKSQGRVVEPVAVAAPAPEPEPQPEPVVVEPEPVMETVIDTRLVVPIYFLQDSYVIRADESQKLYDFIELLNEDKNTKVELYGYCNDSGTVEYNDELSQKRSDNVRNWLINKGVDESRFVKSVGMGIDKSDYVKGRRVELFGIFTEQREVK